MYCGPRYAESIDLLYSGNHFDVRHLDTVSDLSRTVLPARFRQIRSLALRWDVRIPLYVPRCEVDEMKQDEQKWEAFWALLASMQGLRQLRVRLTGDIFPMPDSHVMLLEQLRQVKQCESFEVTLPWPVEDIVSVMGPTPFLLISSTVPD
ncbi:MAG: hypothetical protein M1817_003111 [Caeruleum heppii]|nr:MAG: hypothetical protein M1817_003111 [Caeruleum heppii]